MSLILIIEDSQAMATATSEALLAAGLEAVTCLTVTEAISICQERKPDLVLTEYYIQDSTGLVFLQKLAKLDSVPAVVMVTGCGHEEAAARAMSLGALAYEMKSESYLADLPGLVRNYLHEISNRQTLKEKELLKRRLAAQNELAGWLAHNFKNILAASIGYLNLVNFNDQSQAQSRRAEYLNDSRKSQQSAIHLLEQLIRMTETEGGEAERIVAAEVVDEAWEAVKSKVITNTEAQYPGRLEETLKKINQTAFINSVRRLEPIHMVRADLGSIMEALLQNALEAVLPAQDPRILVLGENNGRNLGFTVKDNGRGMSENILKHAVEPFFSTKGEVGVGLSLSLVSSLVIRHGGDLDIQSTKGVGTTVKIAFPL